MASSPVAQRPADRLPGAKRLPSSAIALLLLAAVGCSIILSVSIGQIGIPFGHSLRILLHQITGLQTGHASVINDELLVDVIWQIRLPRVLLAAIAGIGLALCGSVMQAAVQNPLADPFILGISSGSSLGATFAIMVGFGFGGWLGEFGVASWAFVGALGATALVLGLASIGGKSSAVKLVLAGTVINAVCGAMSNFIIYFAKNAEGIRSVTFWTMGSLASAQWASLPLIAAVVLVALLYFLLQSRILNAMLMGEEAAVTLGVNLVFYRRLYMVLSAVVTGFLVASCRIIGFVGLIVPHIVRGFAGSDHKRLIPAAALFGALFMIWTDVAARTVIPNGELPIGILTSLFGAPIFMYMLLKKRYGFGG